MSRPSSFDSGQVGVGRPGGGWGGTSVPFDAPEGKGLGTSLEGLLSPNLHVTKRSTVESSYPHKIYSFLRPPYPPTYYLCTPVGSGRGVPSGIRVTGVPARHYRTGLGSETGYGGPQVLHTPRLTPVTCPSVIRVAGVGPERFEVGEEFRLFSFGVVGLFPGLLFPHKSGVEGLVVVRETEVSWGG